MERLIGSLFEALGDADWASPFLAGVCAATQSHAAAVLQVDVATRRQSLPAYFGQGTDMAVAFELTHAAGNPWRPQDEQQGPAAGSVVVPDDRLPLARLRKTAFWSDFLRPMDVDHGGGVIGLRDARQVVSLTLLRSARVGMYDGRERAWLGRFAPHWVNACRLRSRLAPSDAEVWDAARVFDALGTAAFLLDDVGRCVRWNAAADALLREGELVWLRGRRLAAASPGQGAMFPAGSGLRLLRRRDGSVAGHAAAHALPGHGALGAARTVVFVDSVATTAPLALRRALVALYGLTPREAELAVRLADGADLAAVAGAMEITIGSARTRLKTVYGKTGATHQAGLAAFVKSLRTAVRG